MIFAVSAKLSIGQEPTMSQVARRQEMPFSGQCTGVSKNVEVILLATRMISYQDKSWGSAERICSEEYNSQKSK